jgi:hypothetical protein
MGRSFPLLDHEIYFLAAGGSPVSELGALESGISPYE